MRRTALKNEISVQGSIINSDLSNPLEGLLLQGVPRVKNPVWPERQAVLNGKGITCGGSCPWHDTKKYNKKPEITIPTDWK